MKQPTSHSPHKNTMVRAAFFVSGVFFFGLGLIGVVIPGMPTTVFVLLAGYCWARSSRRFYSWLLKHKVFGSMIINWQERRAIPRYAKYLAWIMMTASTVMMFWRLPADKLWLAWLMALLSITVAVWMARLPDA